MADFLLHASLFLSSGTSFTSDTLEMLISFRSAIASCVLKDRAAASDSEKAHPYATSTYPFSTIALYSSLFELRLHGEVLSECLFMTLTSNRLE